MGTHNFCFNFGFFNDFFAANPGIKKCDVMKEMGMSDYYTLRRWFDGETMIPLHQLMKFCNLYSVPVTAFFFDEHADDESVFSPVFEGAMTEPLKGWPKKKNTVGIKTGDSRTAVHYFSNLPSYCRTATRTDSIAEGQTMRGAMVREAPARRLSTTATDTVAVAQQEARLSHNERMKYLDIIDKLSKRITEMSQYASADKHQVINQYGHHGMVSDNMSDNE